MTPEIFLLYYTQARASEGWQSFGNSIYFFSDTKKNWLDSRNDCQLKNADLVVINSKEEEVGVCVCVCVRACVRVCVRARVCVCVNVLHVFGCLAGTARMSWIDCMHFLLNCIVFLTV